MHEASATAILTLRSPPLILRDASAGAPQDEAGEGKTAGVSKDEGRVREVAARDGAADSASNGAMDRLRRFSSIAGLLLAAEAFAVWAVFALPRFTGRANIREAWDSEPYWMIGIPVLLASLGLAGVLSKKPVWLLAAYAALGHALAVALIAKDGVSLGLLPLTIVLVGVPLFALFVAAAWLGRKARGMIGTG